MVAPKPYDPVKSIEGMYHGTVTRIAYAFKDPTNFGQSTKTIIQECSKQFQDALDDCEIQILDAKWYLEHQLHLRKQKREAKAREEQAASAKRKRSEIEDIPEKKQENKRVKVDEESKEADQETLPTKEASQSESAQPEPKTSPVSISKEQLKQEKPATPPKLEVAPPEKPPETLDDLFSAKPTPADPGTAAATLDGADDFNQFESMFGEAGGDDGMVNTEGDLGFDLGMGDDVFAPDVGGTNNEQQGNDVSDLNALLPGLESYANQDTTNNGANASQNNTTQSVDFGLPELGGPNEFDMMFDAENFDGMTMEGDMNMIDDENANLDLNMDLESMFS